MHLKQWLACFTASDRFLIESFLIFHTSKADDLRHREGISEILSLYRL